MQTFVTRKVNRNNTDRLFLKVSKDSLFSIPKKNQKRTTKTCESKGICCRTLLTVLIGYKKTKPNGCLVQLG